MRRSIGILAGLVLVTWASAAQAHFLFLRLTEPAEGGRFVEVYFSDRAEAGDPKFVEKIADTKLWRQTPSGECQPLRVRTAADRLRAFLPDSDAACVVGALEYGVITRNGVPFLLRYYPKAVSGTSEEIARFKPCANVPVEILAQAEKDEIVLTAIHRGKPVADAVFTTIDEDLQNVELKADEAGQVRWKPPATGRYCAYVKVAQPKTGEHNGQHYDEIREFATITWNWPLAPSQDDPEAAALFDRAIAHRAAWKDFPGFAADVHGSVDGRIFDGSVQVDAKGNVMLKIDEKLAEGWLEDQFRSLVTHRRAAPRTSAKFRFGHEDDDRPLGKLVILTGGRFASSYRIRDDQITVVNRQIGPENMTITVLDTEENPEHQYLPRTFVVEYWDAVTGDLLRAETTQNRWTRVGSSDLPTDITVTEAHAAGLTVRSCRLTKHRLLNAE
ncbi:MAG TPA: DUF3386 family protein [Planctomycetaceae bacterium]|nr:DUF3386 family protein [Planctomycetaceae bacterium]